MYDIFRQQLYEFAENSQTFAKNMTSFRVLKKDLELRVLKKDLEEQPHSPQQ